MTLLPFTKKALIIISLILGVLLLGFAADVFLLIFASIVLAVLLTYISNKLAQKFHVKYLVALVITCLGIIIFIGGVGFLIAPSLGDQVAQLQSDLPKSIDKLKEQLSTTSWGKEMVDGLSDPKELLKDNQKNIVSKTTGIFSSTLATLANVFIVLITALFLASEPKLYLNGFLKLFLPKTAERLRQVFYKSFYTLSSWLKGKFLSMLVVGVFTYIGLLLLGFPIPIVLALIAMALTFIPNIGPLLALIPAALVGLMEGPDRAFHVILLYVGIQIIESYLITPFINKKAVSLPPALTLFWQILFGTFLGGIGLLLATPLLAVILVFVQELYISDYLKGQPKLLVQKKT
jgi:predicted PurR-regulated permease PerM